MAVLDLEQLVDLKVRDQLTAANGTVEGLIRQALDRQLTQMIGELVEAELETRANGKQVPATPATKVCKTCRRDLPVTAFEKHRGTCRECRRDQARSRDRRPAASGPDLTAEKEPPRPGDQPS